MSEQRDLIREAVIQLIREGKKPSWRLVREIIGVGSSTDLSRKINQVMQDLVEDWVTMADCPPEIAETFTGFWRAAKEASAVAFASERQTLEMRATEAEAAKEEYHRRYLETERLLAQRSEQLAEQTQTVRSLEGALSGAQATSTRLEAHNTELAGELKALTQRIAKESQAHAAALAAQKAALEQAHEARLAQTQKNLTMALDQLRERLMSSIERYDKDTAQLNCALDEARQEAKLAREALTAAALEQRQQLSQIGELKSANARLDGQMAALQAELARVQAERNALEEERATLRVHAEHLNGRLAASEAALAQVRGQLEGCRAQAMPASEVHTASDTPTSDR